MDNSHKTAISRKFMSAPLQHLLWTSLALPKGASVLDFGSGKGMDIQGLRELGYNAVGYDPYWSQNNACLDNKYDIVLCTYVLNVVDLPIRGKIIKTLKGLTKPLGKVYITVRRDVKEGLTVSKRGTHQYYVDLPLTKVKENSSFCIYEI